MSPRCLLIGPLCLAVQIGCGNHPASPPDPAKPGAKATSGPAEEPAAGRGAGPAATSPADAARIDSILGELTQAVRRYGVERQAVPKSLEDVVAAGYLSQVPPAPPGKRFAIDRKLQVYLADQ